MMFFSKKELLKFEFKIKGENLFIIETNESKIALADKIGEVIEKIKKEKDSEFKRIFFKDKSNRWKEVTSVLDGNESISFAFIHVDTKSMYFVNQAAWR